MRRAWLPFAFFVLAAAPAPGVLDSIVARVDREVLTWSEVLQEREVLRAIGDPDGGLSVEAIREEIVRRTLMALEAERQLLRIDPAGVEEQVEAWADRGGADFWTSLQRFGIDRRWLEARARRILLAEQFRVAMRELTFVSEADIRDAYRRELGEFSERPAEEAWEAIRARLAETVFQGEMEQWLERQESQGRVTRNPLPEG